MRLRTQPVVRRRSVQEPAVQQPPEVHLVMIMRQRPVKCRRSVREVAVEQRWEIR